MRKILNTKRRRRSISSRASSRKISLSGCKNSFLFSVMSVPPSFGVLIRQICIDRSDIRSSEHGLDLFGIINRVEHKGRAAVRHGNPVFGTVKLLFLNGDAKQLMLDHRGWDGWMASSTQWTWVWVNSGSWWLTGKPGVLQSMGSQSQTQLSNWTELILAKLFGGNMPV